MHVISNCKSPLGKAESRLLLTVVKLSGANPSLYQSGSRVEMPGAVQIMLAGSGLLCKTLGLVEGESRNILGMSWPLAQLPHNVR